MQFLRSLSEHGVGMYTILKHTHEKSMTIVNDIEEFNRRKYTANSDNAHG